MYYPSFIRYATEALDGGANYLLRSQSRDGFWRDYHLPPGMSEAWSTGWVGWSLAQCAGQKQISGVLRRAALALHGSCRQGGWGYNCGTTADADSTAWSLRFLDTLGVRFGRVTTDGLEAYLDLQGRAHTFLEPTDGSWADAHADVTPVVGLALLSTGAPLDTLQKVRTAVLNACAREGVWHSFWWPTDAYATAWSLEFLRNSGGIPRGVATNVESWLRKGNGDPNSFECSFRLLIMMALGLRNDHLASQLVGRLLDSCNGDNGWEPSSFLRVPRKTDDPESKDGLYPDTEGLMTTAIVCVALARWLQEVGVGW
jgi:hypothetical protein